MNFNRTILFILLFVFSLSSQAQIHESMFWRFGFELSFPTGKFAEKGNDPMNQGLANMGAILNLHIGVRLSEYIGITVAGMQSGWSIDTDAIEQELNSNITFINPNSPVPIPSRNKTHVNADPWQNLSLLAGLYTSFAINRENTLSIGLKALGGYSNTTLPKIWTEVGSPYTRSASESTTPALLLGSDLRYDAGEVVALFLHLEYFYAPTTFQNVELIHDSNFSTSDVNIDISSINIGIGFAFKFGSEKRY